MCRIILILYHERSFVHYKAKAFFTTGIAGSLYTIKKDFSYEKLSAKLELMGISIHKQSLYDIENNKRTVKDYELFGIAHVLGIDVNDLLKDISTKF